MGKKRGSPPPVFFTALLNFALGLFLSLSASPLQAGGNPCSLTVLQNDGQLSGNARAPNTNFRWGRAVYLITAAELASSGFPPGSTPSAIGWSYHTGGVAASIPLILYMENTADTTNTKSTAWATAITGMTMVHNAMTALPATPGPFDVTLVGGSPLTYTGGGLYIALDWGEYTGTLSTGAAAWCNSTSLAHGLLGAQSNNSVQQNLVASNFRPETRLNSSVQNDASVTAIYSLGELPLGMVPAQAIKAVITNSGANSLTNLPVTLNVTGADIFTDTQIIPSLTSCGGRAIVSFAAFTPGALGSNSIQVSIPGDDVAANNTISKLLSVTPLSYSYKLIGSTTTGGIGLNGGTTGALVSKFTTSVASAVTGIRLEFFEANATTYRTVIYGDSGFGTPSTTALYLDSADRTVTVAGPVTITLPTPVSVGSGNFYVGIQQTNVINAGLGFEHEAPLRSGTFFQAFPNPPNSWFDLGPGSDFKLNIGVILQDPNATPTPTPGGTPTPPPTPTPTPPNTLSISGNVVYCSNPSVHAVPGVTMNLTGNVSGSALTDGLGDYTFSGLPSGGTYTVTPTKAALSPGSAGINTVDVIATQRHFLSIATIPPGCRLAAADINGDTAVNTVDVIAIQRFFLGLPTGIANVGKYQFSPTSRPYTAIVGDQTAQNYNALIFGDVSGTFVHRSDGGGAR